MRYAFTCSFLIGWSILLYSAVLEGGTSRCLCTGMLLMLRIYCVKSKKEKDQKRCSRIRDIGCIRNRSVQYVILYGFHSSMQYKTVYSTYFAVR